MADELEPSTTESPAAEPAAAAADASEEGKQILAPLDAPAEEGGELTGDEGAVPVAVETPAEVPEPATIEPAPLELVTLSGPAGPGVALPGGMSYDPQATVDLTPAEAARMEELVQRPYTVEEISAPLTPTGGYAARSIQLALGGDDARTLADLVQGLRDAEQIKTGSASLAIGWLMQQLRRSQRGE